MPLPDTECYRAGTLFRHQSCREIFKFSVGKAGQLKTLEEQEGKGDDSKEGAGGKAGQA